MTDKKTYGVTATRRGLTEAQRTCARRVLIGNADEIRHGDCFGGDAEIHKIACDINRSEQFEAVKIIVHPPDNDRYRAYCNEFVCKIEPPKPYLERNKDIVDASDVLLAFPGERKEQHRSGTWSTIRYARDRVKKTVFIVFPDGEVIAYNLKSGELVKMPGLGVTP